MPEGHGMEKRESQLDFKCQKAIWVPEDHDKKSSENWLLDFFEIYKNIDTLSI